MNTSLLFKSRSVFSLSQRFITQAPCLSVRRNNANGIAQDEPPGFEGEAENHQAIMKITQRFAKDPSSWPAEDQPFAMVDRHFLGRVMHMVELRPERGFANFVPVGVMLLRHMWRKFWAKGTFERFKSKGFFDEEEVRRGTKRVFELISQNAYKVELRPERGFANFVPVGVMLLRHMWRKFWAKGTFERFKSKGFFDEEEVRRGTKRVFELISQNAYKNTMMDLVERGVASEATVKRFEGAGSLMSPRQRDLLNLTEEDIFAIAPGVLGPYQVLRPLLQHGEPYLVYSVLGCAMYKKKMLFDAVKHLELLDNVTEADSLLMPSGYGYDAPRTIFGYITFGHRAVDKNEFDPEVKLLDFQFLVM